MITNIQHSNMLISPARSVVGRVELLESSTLSQTFSHTDALSSFTLSRAGDKKFFGFGICQELELKLIDRERAINIVEGNILKVSFGVSDDYVYPAPPFTVSADIKRDENTNDITVKAYDALYTAKNHTIAELGLTAPYTIGDVANSIATYLGLTAVIKVNVEDTSFDTSYQEGANFEGSETLRRGLDAIAEATQTIYYIDSNSNLIFKRMDMANEPVLTIRKADYFTLESKTNRILSDICSATELGENLIASAEGITGDTQYVRDNPFWDMRDDTATLLEAAVAAVGGFTLNQFTCKWRGNYLVEPGDKIGLITKDNATAVSYLLNEKYVYNGGLSAETTWELSGNNGESADNPITIGDKIKQTTAKVDKANQKITLAVNKVDGYDNRLTQLELDNEGISASVQQVQKNTEDRLDAMGEEVETLTNKVEATITPEAVEIKIQEALGEGVNQITTSTGFTFNDEGLTVSKTGSEMTTTITEDGMSVYKDGAEVLTADNEGVKAINLHATTYLHIGTYSRFQDYDGRTGCFWIV